MTPEQAILNRFLTIPVGIDDWVQDYIDSKVEEVRQKFQDTEMCYEVDLREANSEIETLENDLNYARDLNYDLRKRLDDREDELDKAHKAIEELTAKLKRYE